MPSTSTTKKSAAKKAAPAPDDPYRPDQWGSSELGGLMDLEVPSGQRCLVRRPGVEGLLAAGVLRDIDSLTAIVGEAHLDRVHPERKAKGKQPADRKPKKTPEKSQEESIDELLKDPDKLVNVMHTIDRVICHCVVKPEVEMTPNDPTRRKDKTIYADMIDMVDKMFIFNFAVGGSGDLDSFREEFDGLVGSLAAQQDVADEAE